MPAAWAPSQCSRTCVPSIMVDTILLASAIKAMRDVKVGVYRGMASPRNENHRRQIESNEPSLKRLQIEVFWVDANRSVTVAKHWPNTWP